MMRAVPANRNETTRLRRQPGQAGVQRGEDWVVGRVPGQYACARRAAISGENTVVGNISLSLDGRVTGPGGEHDMSWVAAHAVTGAARDHMVDVTSSATTALLAARTTRGSPAIGL
jgi:hypothetical protein